MIDRLRWIRLERIQNLLLDLPTNARLLDIGCWNCKNLELYRTLRPDIHILGVDQIDYGDAYPNVLNGYTKLDLDKDSLPFKESSFDLIRMDHILEHLCDPQNVMGQIKRLLKRGGEVYISTPNERSLFIPSFNFGHKAHGPFNFFDDPTHLRPVTTHGLYCWLENAGFTDKEIVVGRD